MQQLPRVHVLECLEQLVHDAGRDAGEAAARGVVSTGYLSEWSSREKGDSLLLVHIFEDVCPDHGVQVSLHVFKDQVEVAIVLRLEHIEQPGEGSASVNLPTTWTAAS